MRIVAFTIFALLVVANLTVKSRIKSNPSPFRLSDFVLPLLEFRFCLTVAANFFFFFGVFLPQNFLVIEARDRGMSPRLSEYLISILNSARGGTSSRKSSPMCWPAQSIFGRILPDYLGDRLGRFNIMIMTTFFSAIVVLALWIPAQGNVPTIVFAAIFGFSSGTFVSMVPSLIAQISDIRQIGVRNGTNFLIIAFAALCGNPIGGALICEIMAGTYISNYSAVSPWPSVAQIVWHRGMCKLGAGDGGNCN